MSPARWDVRSQFLAGMLLVLASVLVVLLLGFQQQHRLRRDAVLDDLGQTAQAVAALVDAAIDEMIHTGQVLATDPVVQTTDRSAMRARLERIKASYPAVTNAIIVDATGRTVATTGEFPIDVGDRPYFQAAMATGEPTVSEVVVGRGTGLPIVTVAVPIRSPLGRTAGAVLIGLELDSLAQRLEQVGMRPGQAVFLAGSAGQLAYHSLWGIVGGEGQPAGFADLPEVEAARAGEIVRTTGFRSPIAGDERVAAILSSPVHGWIVGATWPEEAAFGALDVAHRRQLLELGVVSLAAVALAVLLANVLTRPMQRLARQAGAVARGEFSTRVDTGSAAAEEIRTLAAAFNGMAEDLAEQRRERDRFLSTVAHDLAGPITAIKGNVSLIKRWGDRNPDRRVTLLDGIDESANGMERLRRDLLDVSRMIAGRFDLRRTRVDLTALVGGLAAAWQENAPDHRIIVDAPEPVVGDYDRDRLAQVFGNLLSNAIKYAPEGGDLRVKVESLAVEARVCIADQGVGMSPEDAARLFAPFMRLERTRGLEGTGLGLYITRGIVEAHGGRVWAESAGIGYGSTFCVSLPKKSTPASVRSSPLPSSDETDS